MSSLDIRPLSPALADDYLAFFDTSFPDNPDWSGCYCLFHHSTEEPWDAATAATAAHRAARAAQLARGGMPGYLAYLDGRVVGWLNAGPRSAYASLRRLPDGDPGEAVVMCFVVHPAARRRGVATALLRFALADLAARGIEHIEAYPPRDHRQDLSWEAGNYKGPLAIYLKLGFQLVERGGRTVARRRLVTPG